MNFATQSPLKQEQGHSEISGDQEQMLKQLLMIRQQQNEMVQRSATNFSQAQLTDKSRPSEITKDKPQGNWVGSHFVVQINDCWLQIQESLYKKGEEMIKWGKPSTDKWLESLGRAFDRIKQALTLVFSRNCRNHYMEVFTDAFSVNGYIVSENIPEFNLFKWLN